jgi:hypothetical protein
LEDWQKMKRTKSIRVIAATWILSIAAPLSWAGPQSAGEIRSTGQSVALVAHLPNTARVAWLVSPVPQDLLEDGQSADLVVLQESWTFARGETLEAECRVMTEPDAMAELFTSRPQYFQTSFVSPASFGTRQVRTFPLVADFDPGKGTLTDTQILLIVRGATGRSVPGEASSADVRITVVAL